MYVLDVATILVDVGGKKVRYNRGDDVSQVDSDQLDSMIRLRQVVERDLTQPAEEKVIQKQGNLPDGVQSRAGDWRNLSVASLELDEKTREVLIESGLTSVLSILQYGSEHGSLEAVNGIGKKREEEIQAAIKKVAGE